MLTYEIFSYWLFIWFLFHYTGYTKASPLIFLIIGSIGIIVNLIIFHKLTEKVINMIIINFFIKIIPIFLIFKFPIFTEIDLLFGFFLSYIYIIVLLFNKKNPLDIYLKIRLDNVEE